MKNKSRARKKSMECDNGDRKSSTNSLEPKVCHYFKGTRSCYKQNKTEQEIQQSKDDSSVSYTVYETVHIQRCQNCSDRDCEKSTNITNSQQQKRDTQQILLSRSIPSVCKSCENCRNKFTKSKMLRITGQCLLFVLLASCSGFIFGRSFHSDTTNIRLDGPKNVVLTKFLRPVSLQQFRKRVQRAKSHYDIFRIFLRDGKASDGRIDEILLGQSILNSHNRRDYDYVDNSADDAEYMVGDEYQIEGGYDHQLANQAYRHYNEVYESPIGRCRDPRPEIVHVPADGHRLFFPEYTILHRCRTVSGCCWDEKQECGVKRSERIERPFMVLTLHPNGDVVPDGQSVETKHFENHTECECKDLTPLPSCERQCPFPFIKQRPGEECICDCQDDTPMCLEIKHGKAPLGEEEFECVKQDRCLKPHCQEGEFVMEKGYCPGVRSSAYSYHSILPDRTVHHKHRHHHGENGHRKKYRDKGRTKL